MKSLLEPYALEAKDIAGEIKVIPRSTALSHLRRFPLEVFNFLFNHEWVWRLIGFINARFPMIEGIFLVYPANDDYALAYLYSHRIEKVMWNPWPCGILWQDRKITLMFCVTAHNGQFTDPANAARLTGLIQRIERLQKLLHIKRKTFAGILPGVLYHKRIIRQAPEADLTAQAIVQAVKLVKTKEKLSDSTSIVILGGKGFIGRRVIKLLDLNPSLIYSIDLTDGQDHHDWPDHLIGERIIVVNITLKNQLANYVEKMWAGTVVLNEVYPEPPVEILNSLKGKGCDCYHVVGVSGSAIPSFPAAYQGAIPCCAAWPSPQMKVVVRKMN